MLVFWNSVPQRGDAEEDEEEGEEKGREQNVESQRPNTLLSPVHCSIRLIGKVNMLTRITPVHFSSSKYSNA